MRNSIVFARGRVVSWPRSTRAGGSLLTCPRRVVPTSSPIRGMRRRHAAMTAACVSHPHSGPIVRARAGWSPARPSNATKTRAGGGRCETATIAGPRASSCDAAPTADGPTTNDERRRARCTGCSHAPVHESIGRVGTSSGRAPRDGPLLERPIRRSRPTRLDTRTRRTARALGSWGKARLVGVLRGERVGGSVPSIGSAAWMPVALWSSRPSGWQGDRIAASQPERGFPSTGSNRTSAERFRRRPWEGS